MKRIIALVLSCVMLLTGCTVSDSGASVAESIAESVTETSESAAVETTAEIVTDLTETATTEQDVFAEAEKQDFSGLDDPELLTYMEDSVYSELEYELGSDDYIVENVASVYISKEYIEELAYNSQENIFFGYTLSELDAQFQGEKYIFTLGEDNQTDVVPFEEYEGSPYEEVLKNVAVGTGVILFCVTISVATKGTAISTIFAASAKTALSLSAQSGVLSGVSAGIAKGVQTQDFGEALETAATVGSESFKWGAISGAIISGATESFSLYKSSKTLHTWRESEKAVLKKYGGTEQVAYKDGKQVAYSQIDSTRPDVVIQNSDGTVKAIEVKNYDLKNHFSQLKNVLKKQVTDRVQNLPKGSTQEIVLDVRGRGYSKSFIKERISALQSYLNDSCQGIQVIQLAY